MSNWTDYVKQYAIQHGLSYGEALRKAAPSYRRGGVVLGGKKKRMSKKSGGCGAGMLKKRSYSGSKVSSKRGGARVSKKRQSIRKCGKRKPILVKNYYRKAKNKKAYAMGKGLGEMFGGVDKGALAALLSGLDASVKIR